MTSATAIIILAAGAGTRMGSGLKKVLHPLAGQPLLTHVLTCAQRLQPAQTLVVLAPTMPDVAALCGQATVVEQPQPQGSGDAVRCALPALHHTSKTVVVIFGDTPLLQPATIEALIAAKDKAQAAFATATFTTANPGALAKVFFDSAFVLQQVVEYKDQTPDQRTHPWCNGGILVADAAVLHEFLPRLTNNNAAQEYYLFDVLSLAKQAGHKTVVVPVDEVEMVGINTLAELAQAEALWQQRQRQRLLAAGVIMPAPETVYCSADTTIAAGAVIEPYVIFGAGVQIQAKAQVRAFSYLEHLTLGVEAVIGPFARSRGGANVVGAQALVGSFVDIKNATLGAHSKAAHLAVLSDVTIGQRVNIGAGTVTANYDGFYKHHTTIQDYAFIGSNSTLVAPLTVGTGAYVAGGSVVTRTVSDNALAIERSALTVIPEWANAYRDKKRQGQH